VTGAAEAFDLANLGNHEHRSVGTDPAQLAEDVDARVMARESVDLTFRLLDLAVESPIRLSRLSSRRRVGSRRGSSTSKRRPPRPKRSACSRWIP
jgi:hypothetical protein